MNLVDRAYLGLWDNLKYVSKLKYSSKFNDYNANIRLSGSELTVSLSRKWKGVSSPIVIGCVQSLLLRLFKEKAKTTEIDLYNIFMQKVHISVPKVFSDPILEDSFDRMNEEFFYGLVEKPNLRWGKGISKLGSYEYGSDTISISKHLSGELLDYVMYHEMLHKKHKFRSVNGKSYHHTSRFRKDEKAFPDSKRLEGELQKVARKKKGFLWF